MPHSPFAERIAGPGFIAALDQSGGSTPKALEAYGIARTEWKTEDDMYELVHAMRSRIMTNPVFDQRINGAILFERTMNGQVDGMPTARYLSERENIAPFLKIDEGLQPEADGVQLMKPIIGLDARLRSGVEHGVFGTKMRSLVKGADARGIQRIVEQQFAIADEIQTCGLTPIIEPEVDIHAPDKARAEALLRDQVLQHLDRLPREQQVMLKLTLPDEPDFYRELVAHPRVLRVVALSGGYRRKEANEKLKQNNGMGASFSRALVEDLRVQQSDEEFTAALNAAIQSIYDASLT